MTSAQFYLLFYFMVTVIAGVAAYLKIIPPDYLGAALLLVIGHGTGVSTPTPLFKGESVKENTNVPPTNN